MTTEYTPTDDPTGGWGATFHRHFASNEVHRDGGPECTQSGSPRPVYAFDPDALAAHDREVAVKTLREAAEAMTKEKGLTFADALMVQWLSEAADRIEREEQSND